MSNVKLASDSTVTIVNANGASISAGARSALTADIDNSSTLDLHGVFEIQATFGTAPTAGKRINIYIIPAPDGTNYADGSDTLAPSANLLAGWCYVRNVNTAQRMVFRGSSPDGRIHLPAGHFKVIIENLADQGISANWTLKLFPTYLTVV